MFYILKTNNFSCFVILYPKKEKKVCVLELNGSKIIEILKTLNERCNGLLYRKHDIHLPTNIKCVRNEYYKGNKSSKISLMRFLIFERHLDFIAK